MTIHVNLPWSVPELILHWLNEAPPCTLKINLVCLIGDMVTQLVSNGG